MVDLMEQTDVRVLDESLVLADVTGVGGSAVNNLPLCTVAGFINTLQGPIIGIFHQYVHYGEGTTIHSVPQLSHFGMDVDEKSIKSGMGKQCIITPDGFTIPLSIHGSLAYMDMQPPSDSELASFPHIMFTSDAPWDPSVFDMESIFDQDEYTYPVHTSDTSDAPTYTDDVSDLFEEPEHWQIYVAKCT